MYTVFITYRPYIHGAIVAAIVAATGRSDRRGKQPTGDSRGDRLPVVYTRGDRRRDGRRDDRSVYTAYK